MKGQDMADFPPFFNNKSINEWAGSVAAMFLLIFYLVILHSGSLSSFVRS
jgi:hypothetical protein